MLVLSRKAGEEIVIGEDRIDAPPEVAIVRDDAQSAGEAESPDQPR